MAVGNKLKVAFFVPDLSGGGAERIVITFLENLDRAQFDPILIVCNFTGVYSDSVPKDVPVFSLNKKSKWSLLSLAVHFKKLVNREKPDVVLSFLWYADAIQLLAKTKHSPVAVCSIHTVPSSINKESFGWFKTLLLKSLYKRANKILGVSQSVINEFNHFILAGQTNKSFVQYNPFDFDFLMQKAKQPSSWKKAVGTRIIFVGRLEWIKGPDLFLDVLSILPSHLNWHAKFVGTGSMNASLVEHTAKLGLTNRVDFDGFVSNPFPLIRDADILVVTSRFEAFPSVIVEALHLETAVVSYDCPSGPAAILNSKNGILVPFGETKEFTAAIQKLIEQPEIAKEFSQHGPESVAHLASDSATRLIEEHLIAAVGQNKRNTTPSTNIQN